MKILFCNLMSRAQWFIYGLMSCFQLNDVRKRAGLDEQQWGSTTEAELGHVYKAGVTEPW